MCVFCCAVVACPAFGRVLRNDVGVVQISTCSAVGEHAPYVRVILGGWGVFGRLVGVVLGWLGLCVQVGMIGCAVVSSGKWFTVVRQGLEDCQAMYRRVHRQWCPQG